MSGRAVGAVDVEEAGDGGGDFVEVVKAVSDEFRGAFGGGVGCEGAVGGSGFEEGDGVGGVDGAGGGDDEASGRGVRFCRGLSSGVEEVHGALYVDLSVREWVVAWSSGRRPWRRGGRRRRVCAARRCCCGASGSRRSAWRKVKFFWGGDRGGVGLCGMRS